ncbi:unnamed protein product, partial [Phaeothamnion confervicola]
GESRKRKTGRGTRSGRTRDAMPSDATSAPRVNVLRAKTGGGNLHHILPCCFRRKEDKGRRRKRIRRRRPWLVVASAASVASSRTFVTVSAADFTVGVLVPWRSGHADGLSMAATASLAAAAINDAGVLPTGYDMKWAWADPGPGCNPGATASATAALEGGYALDALLGTDCSVSDAHATSLASSYNLTLAGWASTDETLNDAGAYPNRFSVIGDAAALNAAVAALVAQFGWEALAVFYASGGRESAYATQAVALRATLETAGVAIDPFLAFRAFDCGATLGDEGDDGSGSVGLGGGSGDWAGDVTAAAAALADSGRTVAVVIGGCDDYRRWMVEASRESLLEGRAWVLSEAHHPHCHSLSDLCGDDAVDDGYPSDDDDVALAAISGALSVGFGSWGADSPGGYATFLDFADAVAAAADDDLSSLLPPPSGTAAVVDAAAAATASLAAPGYNYTYSAGTLTAQTVDRYARFVYDGMLMLALAFAAAVSEDGANAVAGDATVLPLAATGISYNAFLSGDIAVGTQGGRIASTVEVLSLGATSGGRRLRERRQRWRRPQQRQLAGGGGGGDSSDGKGSGGARVMAASSGSSYVASSLVGSYDTASMAFALEVAEEDIVWPGGSTSIPSGAADHGSGGGGLDASEALLVTSVLLLVAVLCIGGGCYYVNRRTRRKVHVLKEAEKELREKNSRLEGYARPSSRQAGMVERTMNAVAVEEQQLLESVQLEAERLEIGEVVGAGSFAEVRRGSYRGTPVAIKTLKQVDEQSLQRFKAEILLMKDLRHPNIVLLIGASWKTGRLMMVTEFFERGNLADILNDRALVLTWQTHKYRMLTDIVRGMGYLHSARYYDQSTRSYQSCIMHRDLKPQNMLVTATLGIKITDFGEARLIDSDYTMTQVGTLLYIAPEIVRGDHYDEKCDVYSFAIVLLAMLQIKRHVFESFVDALHKHRKRQWAGLAPPPPSQDMGNVPAGAPWGPGGGGGNAAAGACSGGGGGGGAAGGTPRYTPHMVTVAIVNEHLRPEIPPDVYPSIAMLVEQSWDPDPAKRPSFKEILEFLETICKEDVFGPGGEEGGGQWTRERDELMVREAREREEKLHRQVAEKIFERHGVRRASAVNDGAAAGVAAAVPGAGPATAGVGTAGGIAAEATAGTMGAAAALSTDVSFCASDEEKARVPVRIAQPALRDNGGAGAAGGAGGGWG